METETIVKSLADELNVVLRQKKLQNPFNCDDVNRIIGSTALLFTNCTLDVCSEPQNATLLLPSINECLKILKNACSLDSSIQIQITKVPRIFELLIIYLIPQANINQIEPINSQVSLVSRTSWQFLANLSVGNNRTQDLIWQNLKNILYGCLNEGTGHVDICTMIVYNIFLGGSVENEAKTITKSLLRYLNREVEASAKGLPDFLQIFLEYFIIYKRFVPIYASLEDEERLLLLFFIADHLKQNPEKNGQISKELLQYISKEFKKKSDCVLKTVTSYLDNVHPKEVIALLDVLANATAYPECLQILSIDASLFLNIGCLLQAVHALGKKSANIFTPMQKLDQVAPNSSQNSSIEKDFSYGFKSSLIRVLGNLSHENQKNQDLAREMDILTTVLECTCMDGRNPLIKEWSILAIRNLCDNNRENQLLIAGLTKVGDGDNSEILKEFNIDMGSLRIG